MPRKGRELSCFNLYHVVIRGIDRQVIFEDEKDYISFLSVLLEYKKLTGFKLHAYCLMSNHVHLLIEPGDESLSNTMKRIEIKFARWYNLKYNRHGYLFQSRFASEPINDEKYYMTVFRYIHQNPMKAGLERRYGEYPWTSFREYMINEPVLVTRERSIGVFGSLENLIDYVEQPMEKKALDVSFRRNISDDEIKKLMKNITGCANSTEFKSLAIPDRNMNLRKMYENGIPIRQINRLTGVSRGVITRVVSPRGQ